MKLTQSKLFCSVLHLIALCADCFPLYYADAQAPAKSKIVFISRRDGQENIYVMDEDGQNVRRLTFHPSSERCPSWSPDGQSIVFSSTWDIQVRGQIYMMDSDGNNVRRLINSSSYDSCPKLSQNGQKVVFVSSQHFSNIYVMDIDGKNVNKLIKDNTLGGFPAWSPDGRKIAFDAISDGNNADIYIMNADGTGIQRLTDHSSSDVQPKWLDNRRIVFVSDRDGNAEIYVMDINGGNLRNLTNNPAEDVEPDCWPGYFFIWDISSKGKLSSTWGQIKK